jgi:hypothetical protein
LYIPVQFGGIRKKDGIIGTETREGMCRLEGLFQGNLILFKSIFQNNLGEFTKKMENLEQFTKRMEQMHKNEIADLKVFQRKHN